MPYRRVHLVVAAIIAVTICEQDARSQVNVLPQLAQKQAANFDRSNLPLADVEAFTSLRNGVIDRWHAAVEKQRQTLQGYIDLRFAEIEYMTKESPKFKVNPTAMRRLRLASKGAVDKYLFESATQKGKWYDKQASDLLKQMKAHKVSVKQILDRHAKYDSEFSTEVDAILPIVALIQKTPRLKKAYDAALSDASRRVLEQLQVRRASNARAAYVDFIVVMTSQQLLLTTAQEMAFKAAIERRQPTITIEMMDELDGEWEELITSISAVPRSDLQAIFSPGQVKQCIAIVGELGLELDDDEKAIAKDLIAVGKRFVESQVKLICMAFFQISSPMTGPQQQIVQRERYAKHMARDAIGPRVVHIKTTTQMTAAEQVQFDKSVDQAVDEYVRTAFRPLYEQLELANKKRNEQNAAPVAKSANQIKTEVQPQTPTVNDVNDAVAEENSAIRQVDFSKLEHLTYSGDAEPNTNLQTALLASKLWTKVIANHLTPAQIEHLRKEKVRRFVAPRDAYTRLLVYWFDRAMCMTPKQRQQIIKLVDSNQRPINEKKGDKLAHEEVWVSGMGAIIRVPQKQLLSILSPLQVELWNETIKEFGDMAELEEEVEVEPPVEDEPVDAKPVKVDY